MLYKPLKMSEYTHAANAFISLFISVQQELHSDAMSHV